MDFVSLSKIVPLLVLPFGVSLWLSLLALLCLWRRRYRWTGAFLTLAVAVVVVCGNPTLASALYARHERTVLPLPVSEYPEVDAIVVLGGSLGPPLPPRQDIEISGAVDRLWHGVRLYRAGRAVVASELQFVVQKSDVKRCIVYNQLGAVDEIHKIISDIREFWLIGQHLV